MSFVSFFVRFRNIPREKRRTSIVVVVLLNILWEALSWVCATISKCHPSLLTTQLMPWPAQPESTWERKLKVNVCVPHLCHLSVDDLWQAHSSWDKSLKTLAINENLIRNLRHEEEEGLWGESHHNQRETILLSLQFCLCSRVRNCCYCCLFTHQWWQLAVSVSLQRVF